MIILVYVYIFACGVEKKGEVDLRGDTGACAAAGAVSCLLSDVQAVGEVIEVREIRGDIVQALIGDVLHAGDLLFARCQG